MENNHEEHEWTIIPLEENSSITKFRKIVRRIVMLLSLRQVYARAGRYLQSTRSRSVHNTRVREVMTYIFTTWPKTVLKGTKIIFVHLKRERGVLMYR